MNSNLQQTKVLRRKALTEDRKAHSHVERSRPRFEYLDGIRGIAALYVCLHHVDELTANWRAAHDGLPSWAYCLSHWLAFGHYSVAVFIVLSGYCLMLPIVRTRDGFLQGGFLDYIRRRARRILPPYFAALLLALVLIVAAERLLPFVRGRWDIAANAFTPGVVLSHLFLLHNMRQSWLYAIDPPMWSVATEWQIYFLFPAILLPLWRSFGVLPVLVTTFAASLIPHFFLRGLFDWACPWYLGLFSLGMAGAVIGIQNDDTPAPATKRPMPWGICTAVLGSLFLSVAVFCESWMWPHVWLMDILAGSWTLCLIMFCTQMVRTQGTSKKSAVLRLFDAKWALTLGAFSYSLYLVHYPILSLCSLVTRQMGLPATSSLCILIAVGMPLTLSSAYLFHLMFERRFMSAPRKTNGAAGSNALTPAI